MWVNVFIESKKTGEILYGDWLVFYYQVNEGVHYVDQNPVLLTDVVRLINAGSKKSKFLLNTL